VTASLLRDVARFGLGEGLDSELRSTPLDTSEWRRLLMLADRERLVGLLQAAIEHGAIEVSPEQRDEAAQRHLAWCATALDLERELLRVTTRLGQAGIRTLVLKGAAHAHLLYPDPAWRLFADNDLLVEGGALRSAIGVLADLGYERPVPALRPSFDERFGKGATLRRSSDGREVDLHRSFLFGTYGLRIAPRELFARAGSFQLGGVVLEVLAAEDRLLHLCIHASLGDPDPRLASLRDVVQAAGVRGIDEGRLRWLTERWALSPVLMRTVDLLESILDVKSPPLLRDLAHDGKLVRRDARAIASYVGDDRSYRAKILASLPFLGQRRDQLEFLAAAVLPSRDLRARFGGTLRWYGRGLRRRQTGEGSPREVSLSSVRDDREPNR
jgi:hypothetical protein